MTDIIKILDLVKGIHEHPGIKPPNAGFEHIAKPTRLIINRVDEMVIPAKRIIASMQFLRLGEEVETLKSTRRLSHENEV